MKHNIETIRQIARDCAKILGGEYVDDPNDTWRGYVMLGGVKYIFDAWNSKGQITAWVTLAELPRSTSKAGEIGCDFSRGADAVAREMSRRLIPAATAHHDQKRAEWKAELDRIESVQKKAESLRRAYPDLKIQVRDDNAGIFVSTKYGAKITLDGYVYFTTFNGRGYWTMTARDRAPNLRVEDIDTKTGRAFMRLVNGA